MEYTIEAKPTVYDGVQFRSRLEAHWATFFTMIHWPWIYEPVDLGEWSPDFIIDGAITLLVEVKPLLEFDHEVGAKVDRGTRLWQKEHPGKRVEGVLLGLKPSESDEHWPVIGWMTEYYADYEMAGSWDYACVGHWQDNNPESLLGVCHNMGDFRDCITGGYDGGSIGSFGAKCAGAAVDAAWKAAGKAVQWHKRQPIRQAVGDFMAGQKVKHQGPPAPSRAEEKSF